MAEVLGTISAVAGLIKATESLVKKVTHLVRAIGQVPEVIILVKDHIATWQAHLDALYGFSQRHKDDSHVRKFLEVSGVLEKAQGCLERLASIISSATPSDQTQTTGSGLRDRLVFHTKYRNEVKDLLKQMDENTVNLQLFLSTSTA